MRRAQRRGHRRHAGSSPRRAALSASADQAGGPVAGSGSLASANTEPALSRSFQTATGHYAAYRLVQQLRDDTHIHILGNRCRSTFMGGSWRRSSLGGAGHRRGEHGCAACSTSIRAPMSNAHAGGPGHEPDPGVGGGQQLALKPDLFVIGNVVTRLVRGTLPLMEAILDAGLPYTSGAANGSLEHDSRAGTSGRLRRRFLSSRQTSTSASRMIRS